MRAFQFLFIPAYLICSLLAPIIFAWALWNWRRLEHRVESPDWRDHTGLAAFGMAGISLVVWLVSVAWALAVTGFPYYSPMLMRFYRFGLYSGVVALIACVPAKGKLRWPAAFISFMIIVVWVLTASRG